MTFEIKTSITMQAKPAAVWAEFSNFATYPSWNPFLTLVEGNIKEGEKINIIAGSMKFSPKVLRFEKNQELRWIGKLWISGIFDGEHQFKLIDHGDGSCTFEHNETFTGILVPFFKKKLQKDTKAGFEAMNKALKKRVEAASLKI